ncbi:MAG: hypothetical protein IJ220_05860 [Clostridia bacterium]|nr:hypothetical protein [Clostridia bacterium]
MNARKTISIILGLIIITLLVIMPFHLKQICYEYSMHQEWSLGAWNAVYIQSAIYDISIGVLTVALVLINVLKKSK